MRTLLLALALLTAAPAGAAGSTTSLTVTFWRDAAKPAQRTTRTLRCDPPGGTIAQPAVACRRLRTAEALAAFRPIPKRAACTQIYGGPQRAVVQGSIAGRRLWVDLRRRNGCEIDRWARLVFLLPPL
jgi:subtilisin inhibitor-like